MMRTLDLTALRALVAVADSGGVTRAANLLNLTQSAVSMQMKRLEQAVGLPLLEKSGRRVVLTSAGDQLLGYARRMLALNDEAITRLTAPAYEGTLTLGVPHDIVFPHIP
ncbi:MAG: LysR family transcriptional regulator, partial [Pseudomonadota bacterium]